MNNVMEILEGLNDQQKVAATTIDGNIRLVAGAGSGKTNTLTRRVAYISSTKGISPDRILSVTFTNKAAEEMRSRVSSYLGVNEDNLQMMTFHSLALEIVKKDLSRLGFPTKINSEGEEVADVLVGSAPINVIAKDFFEANEHLLDECQFSHEEKKAFYSAVIRYTKNVIKAHNYVDLLLDDNEFLASPREVLEYSVEKADAEKQKKSLQNKMSTIRRQIKDGFARTNEVYEMLNTLRMMENEAENIKVALPEGKENPTKSWARALLKAKFATKTINFDEIIMFAEYLLANFDEVREAWRNKYDYIQVDEFQDTDYSQLKILKLISNGNNLFVVGDPDQSIYIFRGAMPEIFSNLDEHIKNLQTIYMETNYRSSEAIVDISNAVIELNANRLPKKLKAFGAVKGADAPLLCVGTGEDATSPYSTAMLEYKQIKKMLENGVAPNEICVLYRDKNCGNTDELVRMLKNDKDIPLDNHFKSSAFENNFEDITLNLLKYRHSHQDNFLGNFVEGVFGKDYEEIVELGDISEGDPMAVITRLYPEQLSVKTGAPIGNYKKFNDNNDAIRAVVKRTVEEWDALSNEERDLLCSEEKTLHPDEDVQDGLHILTYHKSKGLEFDYVFVNSLEQDVCPKVNNFTNTASLEEDVRLAYVAITRARKQVYLGAANIDRISPFIAQAWLRREPVVGSAIVKPDSITLNALADSFKTLLDKFYMLNYEGIYTLEEDGIVVGYRYATMLNGSRVYFHANVKDVRSANATPNTDFIRGKAEVTHNKDGNILSYEEINKTVDVVNVSNATLIDDLFAKRNPVRAINSYKKSKN